MDENAIVCTPAKVRGEVGILEFWVFGGGQNICDALIFNIHIFRVNTDAGLQIDIDFNTESEFLAQGAAFFFTYQWALKTNQTHETAFFFIHLVGLEDPPNHPVSKVR